jgi:hypothetical protein
VPASSELLWIRTPLKQQASQRKQLGSSGSRQAQELRKAQMLREIQVDEEHVSAPVSRSWFAITCSLTVAVSL